MLVGLVNASPGVPTFRESLMGCEEQVGNVKFESEVPEIIVNGDTGYTFWRVSISHDMAPQLVWFYHCVNTVALVLNNEHPPSSPRSRA